MISITLYHFNDGSPKGFLIKGHSGSAESGHDIICASVSSAAYLVANTVLEVQGVKADATVKDGYMKFIIPESAKTLCSDVLRGFALHIGQLEEQYPANVKIITEV